MVTEAAAGGTADTVRSAVISLDLANYANVENITLTGAAALNATGNSGANIIIGNTGANSIFGGGGADTFTGGSGADVFVYTSVADSSSAAQDFFNDFNTAATDIINLSAIDAITAGGGANDTFTFTLGAAFTAAGQVRFVQSAGTSETFVHVNTDSNFSTSEMVLTFKGLLTFDAADFVL